MVKQTKMEAVLLLVAVLLALLSTSPAQNVRAVEPHYITDTAPVAEIGVGEASRARPRPLQPQWTEASKNSMMSGTPSRASSSSTFSSQRPDPPPYLSKETERAVSYVEDVLAGRADVSKGIQDEVFESHDKVPERARPVTTSGYSRIGSSSSSSSDTAMLDRVSGTRDEGSRERVTSYSSRDMGIPNHRDEGTRPAVSGGPREPARNSDSGTETGYNRDEIQPITSSRVVPVNSGSLRYPQEDVRSSVGSGITRDSSRPRLSDPLLSDPSDLPNSRYDGGSSGVSPYGSLSEDDRGSLVPARGSASTSNAHGYSSEKDEDKSMYPLVAGVASKDSYSGNVRKDSRDPTSLSSRDPMVSPSRDTGFGHDRDTVVDRPRGSASQGTSSYDSREQIFDNNRGASSGYSRDTVDDHSVSVVYDDSLLSESDYPHDELRDHLRETMVSPSRGTVVGHSGGTTVHHPLDAVVDRPRVVSRPGTTVVDHPRGTVVDRPRDTVVDRNRDTIVDHSRETEVDHNRDTIVDRPRETIVDNSQGTPVNHPKNTLIKQSRGTEDEKTRVPMGDYSQHTFVDDSRENVPYKSTTAGYHREPTASNSRDVYGSVEEKSERDSELARPIEHPRVGSDEEAVYTSKTIEDLESSFGFHSTEDEDIDGAHSSRPLPKTQMPRQVAATPDRRGPRGPHPPSPCPSVFSYEGTRAAKERWFGVVLISTTETLTGIRLEIALDKRADLLATGLGEVSSVDNLRYTIWNARRRVQPGPPLSVRIFIKFSEQEYEPPRIKTISLNGRQICPKDQATMPAPPKPPARPNLPANRPGQQAGRPGQKPSRPGNAGVQRPKPQGTARPKPQGTARPQQKPTTSGQSTAGAELVDGVACGRIDVQPSPLITYGQRTSRGQWPWHAAIYQSKGTDLSYACGGSLIGKRAVLTAAHCVTRRYIDRPVDSESIVVYLGKYTLKLWSEGGVQDKQVMQIHVHPDYNATDFRADIAILILSSPVTFTQYVKPICLWDKNRPGLNEVEGKEGVVVGWGYDESGTVTEDLMMAKMPVVSQQTCLWSYPQFFSQFTSDKTYCAGFRNGTSVCNGDSGGGMVFPKSTGLASVGSTITWALRGIVSLSTSQANKRVCNTDHYVVFTDVVKFYDWINKYH